MSTPTAPLYAATPLLYSPYISRRLSCRAYLKLENLHPSHSFKHRGLTHLTSLLLSANPRSHLVIASSGNAGLALAHACQSLGGRCTVCVPDGSKGIKDVLEGVGAEVRVGGREYVDALAVAEGIVAEDPNAVLVPSYDDPRLWEGHSTLIQEVSTQLPPNTTPSAIFCSVGGGGLLGGILVGCKDFEWDDVRIVTNETHGSNCFHLSMLSNPSFLPHSRGPPPIPAGVITRSTTEGVTLARLPAITSRAESLGAREPSAGVVKMALDRRGVACVSVGDERAMRACLGFADEHKFLVELACGTALAAAYDRELFDKISPGRDGESAEKRVVVFVVCGGAKVRLSEMEGWRAELEEMGERKEVWLDGGAVAHI